MDNTIKPGDVLFVWGKGIVPDIIEAVTHGPSHVAIFVYDTTLYEAQGGREIGDCPLTDYTLGDCERLEVWGDPDMTDEQRQKMVEYAKSLKGTPYDYVLIPLELLRVETGIPIGWYHENKHRICSSYVYDSATHAGRQWADDPLCTPEGLRGFGVLQRKVVLK
jgi:hypothetical protein